MNYMKLFAVLLVAAVSGLKRVRSDANFQPTLYYFFQPATMENAIVRRFYSCHFLAKMYSLGDTGFFL